MIELRNDRLPALEDKMREYLANGARLGWLVDPLERKVPVYRAGAPPEILTEPDLTTIWQPNF